MADPVTTVIRDPVTDEIDYTYTTVENTGSPLGSYVSTATDYDLDDEYAWSSYTITWSPYGAGGPVVTGTEAVMDDGSTISSAVSHFGALGNIPVPYRTVWTVTDAQGRLDSTTEVYSVTSGIRAPQSDYSYKATDYDAATGRVDYSYTVFTFNARNGTLASQAIDYDVATNNRDYAVTTYFDGRVLAEDFNAATGLIDYAYTVWTDGHTLSQDYDALGRLDYVVERFADGRMTVTDYDLADTQPWSSYSIAYSAGGAITGVTVL